MPQGSLSSRTFRDACAQFATGVMIATVADAAGLPHGLTVNSFTSVSLDPPLVLICIDRKTAIVERFERAAYFGLSVLSEQQQEVSDRFAGKCDDRFEGVAWQPGPHGAPLLSLSLATFECRTTQVLDGGDHAIFLGTVLGVEIHRGRPLLYFGSGYRQLP